MMGNDSKRPVGTFSCVCGFVYSRKGPDKTENDKTKIGRIKMFGETWLNKLHQLVESEQLSYKACSEILKVDIKTIIKYSRQKHNKPINKINNTNSDMKQRWLDLITQYPTYSRTELRKKDPSLYMRIGSGFSQRYINAPTWSSLLKQLIDENPEIDMPIQYFIQEHGGDYAKIASELVDYYHSYAWNHHSDEEQFPPFIFESSSKSIHLKYRIASILINLMERFDADSHELKDEIELIKKLNPQAIVTTNYDKLLETLFPKYEAIVGQHVIRQKKSTDIGHILKIHGSVDECNSIVIEQQDYDYFFKKQIYLIAKLFTYFMEHPIIFIGYSLSDENIKSILYNVKQIIDAETEPLIENMWFIDWSREPLNPDTMPPSEKSISVGNGESVRVNYIKLHRYDKLYEALYQDSVDIELLKQIEETVYNVVKSDTITNLEVDIASLRYLTDRESFLSTITTASADGEVAATRTLVTFADIQDPNQLAAQFTLSATELCSRVYDGQLSYWSHAYDLIRDVSVQTGVNLRASNNIYHVNMNGISRFSMNMVHLLKKVKDMEPYTITLDNQKINYPIVE